MNAIASARQARFAPASGTAIQVCLALIAVAVAAALTAQLVGAGDVREWLGFSFTGVPDEAGEVAGILANNLRMLAALLIACFVAGSAWELARADSSPGGLARVGNGAAIALALLCDAAVAGSALVHALVIGLGVGAYGGQMVTALLPHGPIELVAYSLPLALYLSARRDPVAPQRLLTVGALAAAGLLVAAPLEVLLAG